MVEDKPVFFIYAIVFAATMLMMAMLAATADAQCVGQGCPAAYSLAPPPPVVQVPRVVMEPWQYQGTRIIKPMRVRPLLFGTGYRVRYLPWIYHHEYAPMQTQGQR